MWLIIYEPFFSIEEEILVLLHDESDNGRLFRTRA